MQPLIDAIKAMDPAVFATEDTACAALVAARFPDGIRCHRCGAACTRTGEQVQCHRTRKPHRFTILVGTAFGTKTKPCIRALLLAVRAMVLGEGVGARALGREASQPASTAWRHLHTLRATFPLTVTVRDPAALASAPPSEQRVREPVRAHVGFDADVQLRLVGKRPHRSCVLYQGVGADAVRISLPGASTFVRAQWLHRYMQELAARADCATPSLLRAVVGRIVDFGRALIFRVVRLQLFSRGR